MNGPTVISDQRLQLLYSAVFKHMSRMPPNNEEKLAHGPRIQRLSPANLKAISDEGRLAAKVLEIVRMHEAANFGVLCGVLTGTNMFGDETDTEQHYLAWCTLCRAFGTSSGSEKSGPNGYMCVRGIAVDSLNKSGNPVRKHADVSWREFLKLDHVSMPVEAHIDDDGNRVSAFTLGGIIQGAGDNDPLFCASPSCAMEGCKAFQENGGSQKNDKDLTRSVLQAAAAGGDVQYLEAFATGTVAKAKSKSKTSLAEATLKGEAKALRALKDELIVLRRYTRVLLSKAKTDAERDQINSDFDAQSDKFAPLFGKMSDNDDETESEPEGHNPRDKPKKNEEDDEDEEDEEEDKRVPRKSRQKKKASYREQEGEEETITAIDLVSSSDDDKVAVKVEPHKSTHSKKKSISRFILPQVKISDKKGNAREGLEAGKRVEGEERTERKQKIGKIFQPDEMELDQHGPAETEKQLTERRVESKQFKKEQRKERERKEREREERDEIERREELEKLQKLEMLQKLKERKERKERKKREEREEREEREQREEIEQIEEVERREEHQKGDKLDKRERKRHKKHLKLCEEEEEERYAQELYDRLEDEGRKDEERLFFKEQRKGVSLADTLKVLQQEVGDLRKMKKSADADATQMGLILELRQQLEDMRRQLAPTFGGPRVVLSAPAGGIGKLDEAEQLATETSAEGEGSAKVATETSAGGEGSAKVAAETSAEGDGIGKMAADAAQARLQEATVALEQQVAQGQAVAEVQAVVQGQAVAEGQAAAEEEEEVPETQQGA